LDDGPPTTGRVLDHPLKSDRVAADKTRSGRGGRVLPGVTLFCSGAGSGEALKPGAVAAGLASGTM